MLPPNQALPIKLAMGPDVHDTVFSAELSWTSEPQSTSREEVTYTFAATDGFRGGAQVKTTHHVAKELEKLVNLLKNWPHNN